MSKVIEDLKAAFAGESQANRRYLAFAKKADEEGMPQVARLFRAAAHAETVHALNHLRVLGEVGTTQENLQAAIDGEHYESVTMYPDFMKDADEVGDKKAKRTFDLAWDVEKVHEELFRKMLADLGQQAELFDYYVCPVCGYTHAASAPERCPVCGTPGSRFERIS
jgi:rubrerythrin